MNYGVGYGYPFDCIESITVADGRSTQLSATNAVRQNQDSQD